MSPQAIEQGLAAIAANDLTKVEQILHQVQGPLPPEVMGTVGSVAMADLLLEHGLDLTEVARWWTPGFGVEGMPPSVVDHLIECGAQASPHVLAAAGLTERLHALLESDRDLATAKGGDGCHPLHFARTVEIARLLVEHGAELNARDEDHESTPAQWRIKSAPEVVRFLIKMGADTDIFMAVGLGDFPLTEQLIRKDPECTSLRIGHNSGPFPGIGFKGRGGSIYQWTLGFNLSPHEVALKLGEVDLFDFLMAHSSDRTQFLVACMMGDRERAQGLQWEQTDLMGQLSEEDFALMAKSCWETNLNPTAVRLMLDLGFPIDHPELNHGYTALHNAAWCGDADLVDLLIERGHPIDLEEPNHDSTPLGWAIHSRFEAKRHPEGDFAKVIASLLAHGASFDESRYPLGDDAIDQFLASHLGRASSD